MDFRRIPFQFSSTDPVKRQAELQKRFGLSGSDTKKDKMHLDFANSGLMNMGPEERSSMSSSPRPQHRVPVFVDGAPETMSSVDSPQGSPNTGRKPRVRVVPIEIEGDDFTSKRHRNLSGSKVKEQLRQNGSSWLPEEFAPYVKPPVVNPKPAAPRERTIPVKVEGVQSKKAKTVSPQKSKSSTLKETGPKQNGVVNKDPVSKQNGCAASKVDSKPVSQPTNLLSAMSLKKIEGVLEKLKTYHADVEKFSGTVKDKQYRYLDEMLIRLMLELDNIDTMGNEEVRLSRKAAVKKVQATVDLLEAKVNENVSKEDVEMEQPSSQESDPGIPSEDSAKTSVDSTSEVVKKSDEKVEDIDMENSEQKVETPEKATNSDGDLQTMDVDEGNDSEPVVTTVDTPVDVPPVISEVNEDVTIEELKSDGETNNSEELAQEPVVTFEDSPIEETKADNVTNISDVPMEGSSQTEIVSDIPETTKKVAANSSAETSNIEENVVADKNSELVSNHSTENDPVVS